jgi:hypothetical protein
MDDGLGVMYESTGCMKVECLKVKDYLICFVTVLVFQRGYTVAQLVEALC